MNTSPSGMADSLDPISDLADPALLSERHLTARGARTRAALVAAARVVFERDGYLDSRLTDITAEANCSTGTFYTYFPGKEEVFAAVLAAAQDEMLHPGTARVDPDDNDPAAVIAATNRAYFEAYRRNAKLMMLLEQVATIDERFREIRRVRGTMFAERNARGIAELQKRGIADPDLDPLLTAWALSGMVGRIAYQCFALGEEMDLDQLVRTTTRLWTNALGFGRSVDK